MLDAVHSLFGGLSGILVGFVLGLVGGGGSILAVPLMVYVVGVRVRDPHAAIGTSAFAVAAKALAGLASHARADTVNWRCGGIYAAAGVIGALPGSSAGKAFDGQSTALPFRSPDVGCRGRDVQGEACGRRGERAVQSWQHRQGHQLRFRDGRVFWIPRHRRRLFDRAGPGSPDLDAYFARDRYLSGGGGRIRTYNSLQPCRIRPRHLAPGPRVHRGRRCRQLARYGNRPANVGGQG